MRWGSHRMHLSKEHAFGRTRLIAAVRSHPPALSRAHPPLAPARSHPRHDVGIHDAVDTAHAGDNVPNALHRACDGQRELRLISKAVSRDERRGTDTYVGLT